jgi:hypothetical protein
MSTKDPRVDAYLARAQPFARPILQHLRKVIHEGCPEAQETIKWSCPFFDYRGLLCGFAAFKAHCSLFFWRDIDVSRWTKPMKTEGTGMGQFGKITALAVCRHGRSSSPACGRRWRNGTRRLRS